MKQIVYQDNEKARSMLQAALNVKVYEPFMGVVVYNGEEDIAAFIFNNHDRQNINLTICARGSITISAIRDIARYVFERSRIERVTCVTRCSNARAITMLKRFGFVCEGVLRKRFADGDGLIFSLLRSEQKLIKIKQEDYYGLNPLAA
jgi:hypothetical protein